MQKPVSQTDWEYVKRMANSDDPIPFDPEDGPYDPNDEEATEAYLSQCAFTVGLGKRGPQKAPTKQLVSLRLSKEVLDHFRATGPGWQSHIDETLKQATTQKERLCLSGHQSQGDLRLLISEPPAAGAGAPRSDGFTV